ncbi:nucleoside permease [Opitutales bacterium ASA1]|uniref:MFS transporter n=1 Tax=Congregicoccus parvus TaxID=3081749 RepID=UPI002B298F71|nr:nucleoside permease [Opitutales bacterium ASA1]
MRHLRLHYLAGYAMIGAITPFFPEFLRSGRGFDAAGIGTIFAASQVGIMVAPVLLTWLADRRVSPRVLSAVVFAGSIASLVGLWSSASFVGNLFFYVVFGFAFAALFPSMDGLYFAVQRRRSAEGLATPPYHRIRVLGTIGFIVPSAVLLALVPAGGGLEVILPVAVGFAVLALINCAWLPDPRGGEVKETKADTIPTADAARTLFGGKTVLFCLGVACVQLSHMGYYVFYPVHLVQSLGLDGRWLGAVSTLGVVAEAVLLLGFGWFTQRLGLVRMLTLGAVLTGVRLAAIATASDAAWAIAANLLHGPIILGTLVAPVVYINRLAGDSFRNSMQGVFVVAVTGPSKILGNLLAGWLAGHDTRWVFACGVATACMAALLFSRLGSDPVEETRQS